MSERLVQAAARLREPRIRRLVVLAVVLALLSPSAAGALTYEPRGLAKGKIAQAPDRNVTTVIAVQGFKFSGQRNGKKPARLVGVGPNGTVRWERNGSKTGLTWFYDVDPLPNRTLLVTSVGDVDGRQQTTVSKYDPDTNTTIWSETLDAKDTHDVDLINGDELLVVDMKNYNDTAGRNDDRVFVYNLTTDEIVWEWYFRNHYERSAGEEYTDDWTHANDVDKIGPGRYLISVRNMDQVIVVDRETKEITLRLGTDDNRSRLDKQHNPDLLRGEGGRPTILVADSGNDRVVEYARDGDGWDRTWLLEGDLSWPRDADRLPSGNTLVVDTQNHRVVEVTPTGEIVWEYYAPWAPYDVERIPFEDGSSGPTIAEQNATGTYSLSRGEPVTASNATTGGGDGATTDTASNATSDTATTPGADAGYRPPSEVVTFPEWLRRTAAGTPLAEPVDDFATRWEHVTPWIRPVWMDSWAFVWASLACLLTVGYVGAELYWARGRLRAGFRRLLG
jgi:hypothetical protein